MRGLAWRLAKFWWAVLGIVLLLRGLFPAVRHEHRPAWFWLFWALVPAVIGMAWEWRRLAKREKDERARLGGLARRLAVELSTMEHDLDRVELVGNYRGFMPLPN